MNGSGILLLYPKFGESQSEQLESRGGFLGGGRCNLRGPVILYKRIVDHNRLDILRLDVVGVRGGAALGGRKATEVAGPGPAPVVCGGRTVAAVASAYAEAIASVVILPVVGLDGGGQTQGGKGNDGSHLVSGGWLVNYSIVACGFGKSSQSTKMWTPSEPS